MTQGIPVSYREHVWATYSFRALGILALGIGIAIVAFDRRDGFYGLIFIVAALPSLAINELVAARKHLPRRFVIDMDDGFRWRGGVAEIIARDDQVIALRSRRTHKFNNGIFEAYVRRFKVWTSASEPPMVMCNRIEAGRTDPLEAMITRIVENLKQRTASALSMGACLEGEGWRLAATQLEVGEGRNFRSLPFHDIDSTAMIDDELCIWLKGTAEPSAKIDPASKNAPVLGKLLDEWTKHRNELSAARPVEIAKNGPLPEQSESSSMGRLLFERRKKKTAALCAAAACVLIGLGIGLVADRAAWNLGVALAIAGSGMAYVSWGWFQYVVRCHESGVHSKWGRKEVRIRYAEIESITYGATRQFVNGAYAGTRFDFRVSSPRGRIRYSDQMKNSDAGIENLRDHIAKIVARRMLCEFREGKTVPWGKRAAFLPEGLRFRRGIWNARFEVMPYEAIRGIPIVKGTLAIYAKERAKPVYVLPVSSPNFFAGFFLLSSLLAAPATVNRPVVT